MVFDGSVHLLIVDKENNHNMMIIDNDNDNLDNKDFSYQNIIFVFSKL